MSDPRVVAPDVFRRRGLHRALVLDEGHRVGVASLSALPDRIARERPRSPLASWD